MLQGTQTVLVVEDDPAIGDAIVFALEDGELNVKIVRAKDGDAAMRLVDENKPSVIVLDLMMPRRDGFSVLRELRSDGRIKEISVIVMTAIFGLSEKSYATELGAAAYLTKPFRVEELVQLVRTQLEKSRATPVEETNP